MTPTHTRKAGRLYRYYVATDLLKHDAPACTVRRVPAAEIEGAVIDQVRGLLRSPEVIVRTWRAGKRLVVGARSGLERVVPCGAGARRAGRFVSEADPTALSYHTARHQQSCNRRETRQDRQDRQDSFIQERSR